MWRRECLAGAIVRQRPCQRNGFKAEPEGKKHLELLLSSHSLISKYLSSADLDRKPSRQGSPDDVVHRAQPPRERIKQKRVENRAGSINKEESVHPAGHPAAPRFSLHLSDESLISNIAGETSVIRHCSIPGDVIASALPGGRLATPVFFIQSSRKRGQGGRGE